MAVYLYSVLTIMAFMAAIWISKRWKSIVFNSFVLTILLLVGVLLLADIPYDQYIQGNAPLNNLLGPAIVALALPLYEQLRQISSRWRSILLITLTASVLSMLSGALLALLLGGNSEIVATILPKSISTPIAMAVAETIGGVPSVAAVGVVLAGLQGSIFGYLLLKKIGLKHPEAIGLSIGAVSHALGTARTLEIDKQAGIYSSISLVLCGIISSVLAPLIFRLVLLLV
ncbi:CidB/LrgB family autolysis modulator [Testudinibacter sp. TR-2022]|nr:CidB/LrgB family autolysis modulator [Testudinibacter sp. TR-2022]TNH03414.1 CidB/LrgB family autolysis modulator [Pasteurellaceae bacterium Phil31]TNH07638.1 CidB/LrgB family autolysis modulator [Testudinibacter sp. TR-2022]TNH09850.1 CidB/LrgB family autolysis modulator [Testudinibacter sp. TR-2022]TNH16469.1 CidB/LrgB family autolysis modulator [Testudinibacter sp. TR-2022]TNH16956.1 CidB/LrgB family autolysis modulator [Testudinibacter sp. TR-2022]